MDLAPATCFVLDDGSGRVVGYCIGTSDTSKFAERWKKDYIPKVNPERVPKPSVQTEDYLMEKEETRDFRTALHNAECSALQAWPGELEKYPAHMHIDILPEYQRKGWGSILIDKFFNSVKREGAPGVHLDMVRWNKTGKSFYEKIGFERCSLVLDDGKSGETGVNDVVLTLVKTL